MNDGRTVRISDSTYARIAAVGKFGETVDDVIKRLINQSEQKHKEAVKPQKGEG